jgi:cupin 2 domain-containing protein
MQRFSLFRRYNRFCLFVNIMSISKSQLKQIQGGFMIATSIFSNIPDSTVEEIFETLLKTDHFKLERIISSGQATPPGEWYDQDANEWVILLSGSAGLLFEGNEEVLVMRPGDYVHIPAHRRHQVEWTDLGIRKPSG